MTQHQKIVTLMCRADPNTWLFPYNFMPPRLAMGHECFVGYEATARLAELRKRYPEMIRTVRDGKYKKSQLRHETVSSWFHLLSKDLKQIVAKELDYYPHMPGNKYNWSEGIA